MSLTKMNFILMMILGVLISLSANSWFLIWLGMEMNLIGFIPMMISKNSFSSEGSMKYFFIQTISSSILILISLQNNMMLMNESLLIMMSLMMKMGAAPFHFWIPSIMESLEWSSGFILLTWQKIIPLMMTTFSSNKTIEIYIILSLLFGSMGGLMQNSMKKILAFSSIAHVGWLLTSTNIMMPLMKIYFLIYTLTLLMIMKMNFKLNITQINTTMFINKKEKILMLILMLSLMGMPPLMGFFPKLMIILLTMKNNMIILTLTLITSSMINLYFYLRLSYYTLLYNNLTKKIIIKNPMNMNLEISLIMLGPLIPLSTYLI